jgi:hypothetical protein
MLLCYDLLSTVMKTVANQDAQTQSSVVWLAPALKKLSLLANLQHDWDTYGAQAPNEAALKLADRVLAALAEAGSDLPSVDPSAEGGICLSLRRGNRYGDIECLNSGEVLAAISTGGDGTEVWELTDFDHDLPAAVSRIRSFVGP